jgi:hypothetical protein
VTVAVCAVTALAIVGFLWVVERKQTCSEGDWIPITAALLTWGIVSFLWLAGLAPSQAMGTAYLAFITPALVVGLAVAVQGRVAKLPTVALAAFIIYQVGAALLGTVQHQLRDHDAEVRWADHIHEAGAILVDSNHRGEIGRVVLHADPDAWVYAQRQDLLLKKLPVPSAHTKNGLLYAWRSSGNSAEDRARIIARLKKAGLERHTFQHGLIDFTPRATK